VYTVLDLTDGGFHARRTDTNPEGGASEPTFQFVADQQPSTDGATPG
jgi:hypothetical protein